MKCFDKIVDLQQAIAEQKKAGKTVALVPTMGALHEGHLSLIRRAKEENDIVVVSIFVNPIQFNNKEDLEKYPRTVDADCQFIKDYADFVFIPSVEEMYPEPVVNCYSFGPLEAVMEGPRRPGHFAGVATVVSRLFDIVQPRRAYFGEKDYQQLAIIRDLVRQMGVDIEIVPCPIVRADDGLALSSRNKRLSTEARDMAPAIYATLEQAAEMAQYEDVEDVKQWVLDTLESYHEVNEVDDDIDNNADAENNGLRFEPEYFEIVDAISLQPIANWSDAKNGAVGCIAVWLDGVRLIDMIKF